MFQGHDHTKKYLFIYLFSHVYGIGKRVRTVLGIALILFGPVINLSSIFVAQNPYLLDPTECYTHTNVLNLFSCIQLRF